MAQPLGPGDRVGRAAVAGGPAAAGAAQRPVRIACVRFLVVDAVLRLGTTRPLPRRRRGGRSGPAITPRRGDAFVPRTQRALAGSWCAGRSCVPLCVVALVRRAV